jgi:hypothetical protein
MRVISSVELTKDALVIRYEESSDTLVDERIAVIKWKAHPALRRLTEAYTSIVANYTLSENKTLELMTQEDMNDFFSKLLRSDLRDETA